MLQKTATSFTKIIFHVCPKEKVTKRLSSYAFWPEIMKWDGSLSILTTHKTIFKELSPLNAQHRTDVL